MGTLLSVVLFTSKYEDNLPILQVEKSFSSFLSVPIANNMIFSLKAYPPFVHLLRLILPRRVFSCHVEIKYNSLML